MIFLQHIERTAERIKLRQSAVCRVLSAVSAQWFDLQVTSGFSPRRCLERRHENNPNRASIKRRIGSSVQKNPSRCPVCLHKVVRLQKRCAAVSARSSNTSPVCVKVSGAPNLWDTQSGGQVFHSDVINHSTHNTVVNTALCLSYADFCLRAAEARFQRQRQDFSFPLTLIWGSLYPTLIGWLTRRCIFFISLSKSGTSARKLVWMTSKKRARQRSEMKTLFATDLEDKLTSVRRYAKHLTNCQGVLYWKPIGTANK